MNAKVPPSLAGHLARSVKRLRRRYRKRLARCQRKFSEGSVHDLRIETRRMLAMLDLLRALLPGDSLKKMRRVFKQRLDAFDELRDTHVQILMLQPLRRRFPEAREFELWLYRRERRLVSDLRHEIKATKQLRAEKRLKALERQLAEAAGAKASAPGGALVAAVLTGAFNEVVELRRRVRRDNTETIHQMRVAFKKFRYLSELLQPFFPRLTTKRLREMQEYQAMMGDVQDIEVMLGGLKRAVEKRQLSAVDAHHLRREMMHWRHSLIELFMAAADRLHEFQPEKLTPKNRKTRFVRK